jgi:HK97 family phage portal protein
VPILSHLTKIARLFRRSSASQWRGTGPYPRPTTAGVAVTESTAFTVSAFWCCVRVISETIAQMHWQVSADTPAGRSATPNHPAERLLDRAPNSEMDPVTWRELMLRWALTWGNGYSEIVRDTSYRPTALWPIEPWRVTPTRSAAGLVYQVEQPGGGSVTLPAHDVFHLRGMGDDLEGWSVIRYAARALGLGVAQEASMASQMQHGSRLGGLLHPPGGGTFSADKMQAIKKQWAEQNAGYMNHGRVYVIPYGLEYQPLTQPNTDAQLLESRQMTVIDLCRFFRVPPHMAYDLARATFSNITHQWLEFGIHTLGPWVCKLEQQANRKLISRPIYRSTIDVKSLLRADPTTRVAYYKGLRELGAISTNEVREAEGFNGIGPSGDVYLVPMNLQPIEDAIAPPAPPAPTPAIPIEEENEDD